MLDSIQNTGNRIGDLSVSELNCAENVSIKFDQSEISNEKLGVLRKLLNLFYDDDGIIRVKGRLENSDLDGKTKFPILLKDDYFLYLQIKRCHEDVAYWSSRNLEKIERTILGCPRSSNCQTYYWLMHCLPTSPVERIVAAAVTSFAYLSTYR